MSKVIVCTCAETFKAYDHYWQKSNLDFEYLSDRTSVGIEYNEQMVRDVFAFRGDVCKKHYWNSHGNKNIIWFYAHLRMVYYFILNPNEEWYWFMDDDVQCDNWDGFFKGFENDNTDFLCYYLFKEESVNSQPNVPNIDNNTHSGNGWFNRFPGDGDKIDPDCEMFGSFFPIVRFSNKSLKHLANLMKEGIHGYSEGFVPTQLNKDGFTLGTIYDTNSKSKYFDNDVKVLHKNIETTWSWI